MFIILIICTLYIQVPSLIRSCQTAAAAAAAAAALTTTTTSTTTTSITDTTEGETNAHTANGKKSKLLSVPETAATNKALKLTPTTQ